VAVFGDAMPDLSEFAEIDYTPEVIADAKTAAAIASAGGRLFVWADDSGFKHVSTIAPYENRHFDEYPGNGFLLLADSTVYPPRHWMVTRRRLRGGFDVKLDWKPSDGDVEPLRLSGGILATLIDAFFSRP
jgi:hypothetical protein